MTTLASATPDAPFVVELEAFSGPLDLLLHLIREQEIEITDIPIASIADQFLQTIHQLGLNQAADYLEMAAYLLRIKVQMLLPRPFDEEGWEDPRAELVRRLLEYEQIREVADWLAEKASQHGARFSRGWFPEPRPLPPAPLTMDMAELLAAVESVVEALPEPVLHRVVPRPLDVEGATQRIRELFDKSERLTLLDIIGERTSIADVLSSLIALLELARVGFVSLRQRKPFGSVVIQRERADAAD
jgi:segregation and condensation protein A